MRQLLRRLEEAMLKDASKSAWVAENLAKFAEECAEHAPEDYKGPGSVYPRKWYRKLELDMAENGYGPLSAKQLGLFDEAYEKFMSVIASMPGDKNYQNYKSLPGITKDITNRALALAREAQ